MTTSARLHVADPLLEANLCDGTGVLAIHVSTGDPDHITGERRTRLRYDDCPGCVGCDYDTVSARQTAKAPVDPFTRFPCDNDQEW